MDKPTKIDRSEALKWINLMEHTMAPFWHLKEVLAVSLQAEGDVPELIKQRENHLKESSKVADSVKKMKFDFNEERHKINRETTELVEASKVRMQQAKDNEGSIINQLREDIKQLQREKVEIFKEVQELRNDFRKEEEAGQIQAVRVVEERRAEIAVLDESLAKTRDIARQAKDDLIRVGNFTG